MTFVSFFAGIGGMDLGLERAGHTCVGQVEIDPYCRKVLAKHWPNVWRHDDILTINPEEIPQADMWTGGFPCQDISNAGKKDGIHGARSGLFFNFMRLVCVVRPRYVLLENVAALLVRGMGDVLGELSASGYDAQWDCIPAAAVGTPHERDRTFILAHPQGIGWFVFHDSAACVTEGELLSYFFKSGYRWRRRHGGHRVDRVGWSVVPEIRGSDDGVPAESHGDRLKALGNAVVPQVAEFIGELLNEEKGKQ